MKLVKQPKGSNLCGQACVATIGNISLEDSIRIFDREGRTNTKDLIYALELLGFVCATRLKRGKPEQDDLAIVKFLHPNRKSHWVVWYKGKYYDPIAGVSKKVPKYLSESKQTSFLRIQE